MTKISFVVHSWCGQPYATFQRCRAALRRLQRPEAELLCTSRAKHLPATGRDAAPNHRWESGGTMAQTYPGKTPGHPLPWLQPPQVRR